MKKLSWRSLGPRLAFKLLNFWPPYLGAGIKTEVIEGEGEAFRVQMKLGLRNTNYVGVHFGGSLYSMCDPFYMLILMRKLGEDYIVWDKWAHIDFVTPGRGKVSAEFCIDDEKVELIKKEVEANGKCEPEFSVEVKDEGLKTVAVIKKGLWVVKKR